MDRRQMIKTTALGGAGLMVAGSMTACSPKNLSSYVQMIAGAFSEIKILLPDLGLSKSVIAQVSDLIDKGVKIASDFDAAYKAGKFADALTIFSNLGTLISQVVKTLGVSAENRAVKVALAAIGIARVAIAILLQRQAEGQPEIAAAVKDSKARPEAAKAISETEKLAQTDLSKILTLIPQ